MSKKPQSKPMVLRSIDVWYSPGSTTLAMVFAKKGSRRKVPLCLVLRQSLTAEQVASQLAGYAKSLPNEISRLDGSWEE